MSGVIMEDGTQYEHCNRCGCFVELSKLKYEQPSVNYECGRDLCPECSDILTMQDGMVINCEVEGCQDEVVEEIVNANTKQALFYCHNHSAHKAINEMRTYDV